jgi:uncharacterized LabA/DUF88 family protein
VLKDQGIIKHKSEIRKFSIASIIETTLKDYSIDESRFYAGKIHIPVNVPDLIPKSNLVAQTQRYLKRYFTDEGVEYIMAGHVRLQDTKTDDRGKLQGVFKEKGTDVRIAVDMVSLACDEGLGTALLLSSDSDMQPAVKECIRRGVNVVYIGFENWVNAGLSQTTHSTVLVRQSEVIEAWNKANPPQLLSPKSGK